MNFLPKVAKGLSKALTKTEKVKKSVLGFALGAAVVAATTIVPTDAYASQNTTTSPSAILLTAMQDVTGQAGYHYSHSSHSSHSSHHSHYSSR